MLVKIPNYVINTKTGKRIPVTDKGLLESGHKTPGMYGNGTSLFYFDGKRFWLDAAKFGDDSEWRFEYNVYNTDAVGELDKDSFSIKGGPINCSGVGYYIGGSG